MSALKYGWVRCDGFDGVLKSLNETRAEAWGLRFIPLPCGENLTSGLGPKKDRQRHGPS